KLFKSKTYKNKIHGLVIKGNNNQINKTTINSNNNTGILINGSNNKFIQNTIKTNKNGIHQTAGKKNYFNYNYIFNKKYNLYLSKGSANAEYNWWGENKAYKVKNTKINRYVTAYLDAPNTLKLKKIHNIYVKFKDDKNKKLKKPIPSLKVKFKFDGEYTPLSYNVTKNLAKGKIRVSNYGFYTLKVIIDNQTLNKYYLGDSKGKEYDLNLYIKKLFKKEGVKASPNIIHSTRKSVLNNLKSFKPRPNPYSSNNKGMTPNLQSNNYLNDLYSLIQGAYNINIPKNSVLNSNFGKLLLITSLLNPVPGATFQIYTAGKFIDAILNSNGDPWKFINANYLTIPGYNYINKLNINGIPAGHGIKIILDIALCIDNNGKMSIGGFLINVASLIITILTAGTGTGVIAGIKTGGKVLLRSILPKSAIKFLSKIAKYADDISRFIGGNLPKFLKNISFKTVKEFSMDVIKLFGNLNPFHLTVRIFKSFKSRVLQKIGEDIKVFGEAFKITTEGFGAFVKTINSYVHKTFKDITPLSNLQHFIKGTSSYLTNNLNLKAISKFITDGPANISYLANHAKKAIVNAKNVIVNTVKTVVKKTANTIKAITQKSYNTVTNAYNGAKKTFSRIRNNIYNGGKSLYNKSKNAFNKVYNGVKSVYNKSKNLIIKGYKKFTSLIKL
ncbi:MAG: hypothetical protein LBU40_00005, partial [Methanobrevibacter sp.]|nr:hypothetical protein [Methanobrevibacter sp.]